MRSTSASAPDSTQSQGGHARPSLGMPGNALSDLWSLRRLEWRRSAAESRTQGAIHPDSGMEE